MNRLKSPTAYRLPRVPARALTLAVAACYATTPAWAVGPADLTFRNDPSASVVQSGNLTTITTTVNRSIADAVRFNVARPESVKIFQPNAGSSMLVNVLTPEPSTILGSVWSNGQFMLMNQAGIMVGPGARIDTAAFVASTVKINENDFLAGRLTFQNTPGAGSVTNQGYIKTASGGHVYLIGSSVKNEAVAGEADSGIVSAPGGEVILAAGASVNLIDTGTPGVKVEITGDAGNVTNLGTVLAEAGRIGMAGALVKNSGTLNASSVVSEGGRIFLKASKDAYVDGDGRIVATGTKGGRVEVLGDRVAVMDNAAIDASGSNGGGTILVGGDYQGKNAEVQNSRVTYFGPGASLKADATANGDGGKVIVWADDTTRAYGTISARGGEQGGNGGFVETSGHKYLDVTGIRGVDTRAPNGNRGTWLLDPDDITIMPDAFTGTDNYGGGTFTGNPLLLSGGTGSTSTIYGANIRSYLQSTDVVLTTGTGGSGNITFQAGTYTFTPTNSATYSLSLLANGNATTGNITLPVGTNITMGTGGLTMVAGWDGASTTAPATVSNKGDISYVGGTMTVGGALTMKAGKNIVIGGSALTSITSTGAQTVTAGGTLALYGGDGTTYSALLYSASSQTITAKQINLYGGGTSAGTYTGNTAEIVAYGDQVITAGDQSNASGGGGILIKGGGLAGSTTQYNNAAGIFHGRDSTSGTYSGNQKFTLYGGGTFQITGGSASGTGGNYDTGCGTNCNVSTNNSARAKNYKGSQTIDFIYGGSLSLIGGTEGNSNDAELQNKSASLQKIYSSYGSSIGATTYYPRVTVQGGSTGGTAVWGGTGYGGGTGTAKVYELDNSAGISSGDDSITGTQTIYAYSASLPAIGVYGGSTVSSNGVAHGYIGANGTATLTAYGNVFVKGGGSNGTSNQYERFSSVAGIGNDKNVSSLTISAVGGRVDVYGGAGKKGHALIGSIDGYANVGISGDNGVSLIAGYGGSGNFGGVYIGSLSKTKPDPYTKVKITTGASGTISANGGSETGYGGVYLGTFYNYATAPSTYVAAGSTASYASLNLDFTESTSVSTSVTSAVDNAISSTAKSDTNGDSSNTTANTTTVTTTSGSSTSGSLTSGTVGGGDNQFGGSDSSSSSSAAAGTDTTSAGTSSSSGDTKESTEKKDDKKEEKKDDKKKDGDTKSGDKKDDGAGKKQIAQCKG